MATMIPWKMSIYKDAQAKESTVHQDDREILKICDNDGMIHTFENIYDIVCHAEWFIHDVEIIAGIGAS